MFTTTTTTTTAAVGEAISFQQFQENISRQMNIPIGEFELRYRDDEGDVIPISSDMELQEAVRQAANRNPAQIEVIVETKVAQQPAVPVKNDSPKQQQREHVHHETQQEQPPQATNEIILHPVACSVCQFPIVGVRYKCAICPHFDLCEICEMLDNSHPADHPLIKAKRPLTPEFNHILSISAGMHNAANSVERGFHHLGTNVQHFGTTVHQYGSNVGHQIKQSWKEHQPQIDAARQAAYEKWQRFNQEVQAQVKVISENVRVKAKELSESLKKESEQWFNKDDAATTTSTTTYPGETSTSSTPAPAPAPASTPAPELVPTPPVLHKPAPVLVPASTQQPTQLSSSPPHPSAPAQAPVPTQFKEQMETLASMGFKDSNRNLSLLTRYNGDVSQCVQALLEAA